MPREYNSLIMSYLQELKQNNNTQSTTEGTLKAKQGPYTGPCAFPPKVHSPTKLRRSKSFCEEPESLPLEEEAKLAIFEYLDFFHQEKDAQEYLMRICEAIKQLKSFKIGKNYKSSHIEVSYSSRNHQQQDGEPAEDYFKQQNDLDWSTNGSIIFSNEKS